MNGIQTHRIIMAAALSKQIIDHVLGTNRAMRIRTTQFLLAALLMLASIGVLYFMRTQGIEGMGDVDIWAGFCCAGLVVIFGLIRSGWSLRLADPSLAFWQMLYAIACNAAAFYIAGHGRGVALPLMAVILMFGMFGLSMRQVVNVAMYALVLFGAVILYSLKNLSTNEPVQLFGAYFLMVFVVLSATTFLTWRLQQMSTHMRNQKTQLALALDKIREIATRDELTGIFNRRFMLERLHYETQRTDRTLQPLLIAILDIDHFKRINDHYGHQAGDYALQVFSTLVQETVRGKDTLARWGGEEFLVLLTETDIAAGQVCLERIRAKIAENNIVFARSAITLTVSIGVALYYPGEGPEKAVARADMALYAAKSQGRNQLVWAPPATTHSTSLTGASP